MASILADTSNRVVVCCGAGGVGKTTTAAAMALRAAEYGRTVVVLTIDPAKRLAQALGIKDLGNTPQRVPLAPEVTRRAVRDDARHAPHVRRDGHPVLGTRSRTRDSGQPVLSDRGHLAGGHAGVHGHGEAGPAARPRTGGIWSSSTLRRRATRWTSSTPRSGLGGFMDSRLWKLLLGPGRGIGKLVTGAMGLAMRALSTVLGSQMLSDAACIRADPSTPPSAGSGRRPTVPTSCSSDAALSSSWCLRPSPTRCARRRSSSTGCPRSTCRCPG